jgi:hypothetical protein
MGQLMLAGVGGGPPNMVKRLVVRRTVGSSEWSRMVKYNY